MNARLSKYFTSDEKPFEYAKVFLLKRWKVTYHFSFCYSKHDICQHKPSPPDSHDIRIICSKACKEYIIISFRVKSMPRFLDISIPRCLEPVESSNLSETSGKCRGLKIYIIPNQSHVGFLLLLPCLKDTTILNTCIPQW